MSTKTHYYNFIKPALSDIPDITVFNNNWDSIDSILKERFEYIENWVYLQIGEDGCLYGLKLNRSVPAIEFQLNEHGYLEVISNE